MNELELNGQIYRLGRLNAMQQFHVSRKLAPVLPTVLPLLASIESGSLMRALDGQPEELASASHLFAQSLSDMSDDNAEYIIATCLASVMRQQGNAWGAVWREGCCMFDDMDLCVVGQLVFKVLKQSLGGFIAGLATNAMSASPE